MTLIEGVGDEVTDFFIVVGILFVGWVAWCSTNISEQPLIRTVLILQHRTRTRIAELRANNQPTQTDNRITNFEESSEETIAQNDSASNNVEQSCPLENQQGSQELESNINQAEATASAEEVLLQTMDSLNDSANLINRSNKLSTSESSTPSPTTTTTTITTTTPESSNNSSTDVDMGNEITIKLKFINDDQRLVTGRLKEMLSDFKKRHFQVEIEAQKRVRLVFNGQVLQPDSETLEKCGLFDNCVVHCLVHPPRMSGSGSASNTQSSTSENNNTANIYSNPQSYQNIATGNGISSLHNEWDLSRLLVSILTLILAFAWYSRYYYAQLFTATTTLALYALTAIFTLSVVGHFFPDQDNLRNIE